MVTCPICKSEANEIEGDAFDGAWFRCLKHREFGVSDTALKTRKNAEPEEWERALKKAIERAGPEERPKILDLIFKKRAETCLIDFWQAIKTGRRYAKNAPPELQSIL